MAYNNNIPQPTDLISNSQAQLLANFAAIDSGTTGTGDGFSRNHITMDDADFPGMHWLIEMPQVQSGDPTSTGANYSAIYSKTGTTNAEPFFLNNLASTGKVMWYGGTNPLGVTATINTNGALNLPNGLQFRWGTSGNIATNTPVAFSSAFTTACLGVVAVQNSSAGTPTTISVGNFLAASFTFTFVGGGNRMVNYFAIGH